MMNIPKVIQTPLKKVNYNVKIVTKSKPKSGISFPNAGVHLLMMNEKRETSLHYIPRVGEQQEVRFERGSFDNVMIENVDNLGDLTNVWICPEQGTWGLDKVIIYKDSVQTFTSHEDEIGDDKNPAIILDQDKPDVFDEIKYRSGMNDYKLLKKDLLLTNAYLVLIGTFGSFLYDYELSKSFFEGGLVGILYLYLLEKQTDYFGSMDKALLLPLVSGPVRLIAITYLSVSSDVFDHPNLLLPYTLGFFMYKLAVLSVGLVKN